LAKLSQK